MPVTVPEFACPFWVITGGNRIGGAPRDESVDAWVARKVGRVSAARCYRLSHKPESDFMMDPYVEKRDVLAYFATEDEALEFLRVAQAAVQPAHEAWIKAQLEMMRLRERSSQLRKAYNTACNEFLLNHQAEA